MSASATSAFCPPESCCIKEDGWFVVNDTCAATTRHPRHQRSVCMCVCLCVCMRARACACRTFIATPLNELTSPSPPPAAAAAPPLSASSSSPPSSALSFVRLRHARRRQSRLRGAEAAASPPPPAAARCAHDDRRGPARHELLEHLLEVLRDALERAQQVLVLAQVERLPRARARASVCFAACARRSAWRAHGRTSMSFVIEASPSSSSSFFPASLSRCAPRHHVAPRAGRWRARVPGP